MTLVLPTWYVYGFIASTILKVILFFMYWYRAKICPVSLKHIPGVIVLILLDAVLSWLSVVLILHAALKSEKEFWSEFKQQKQMRLGRG